ncbi:hypothetical protein DyAD56_04175 [Dyella sp. AD56]|uniref:hypothetical protein n=1 Tax=Dyella sp. AD56 TaxID=1528744 RepID=UPI000C84901F|nr:hypothetical protein [Dyella sp. AD56]PMQ06668.1 hypothetical protein DyAD56_04175 [Dyella sp. AD56]
MKRTPANLVAALALALSLFTVGSHAEEAIKPVDGYRDAAVATQLPAPAREDKQLTAPGSQINGRSDWDVDYPSQLAPQALHVPDSAASRKS